MKKYLLILTIGVLATWIGFAFAQQDPVPVSPTNSGLQWNPVTKNADGSDADDIDHYVVGVSAIDQDLNSGGTVLAYVDAGCDGASCRSALKDLLAAVPDGAMRLWVRAVDEAGNYSAWSEPLEVVTDRVEPAAPTGLKTITTVTVTTRTTTETTTRTTEIKQ